MIKFSAEHRLWVMGLALVTAGLMPASQAVAQAGGAPSSQLELRRSAASDALAGAMKQLASQPRNLDALLTAGEAALRLEDPRSALGFFGRADDVSPNNGRVKSGLGRSMLQLEQVGDALRLMEEAKTLGYADPDLSSDRGLARDLTGNQLGAQRDYAAALEDDPKNEALIRRYAVSMGISGQLDAAEKLIQPLLYQSNRAAWRDRAFILAMNGKTSEALDITNRVMPLPLAEAMKPYIERMSMLSPGQRAAAVHMGQFPPGLVNQRIVSTAVPAKAPSPAAKAVAKPSKRDLARAEKKRREEALQRAREEKARAIAVARAKAEADKAARAAQAAEMAKAAARDKAAAEAAQRAIEAEQAKARQAEKARLAALEKPDPAVPVSNVIQGPPAPKAVQDMSSGATQISQPSVAQSISSERSLADIMAEVKIPEAERKHDVAPVNLAEIAAIHEKQRKAEEAAAKEAARKKAEEEARAKARAEEAARKKLLADNPSRIWLQIGVGRNVSAHPFTVRRMKKDYDVIAKYDGWWAQMGQTKRIIVGPFADLATAKAAEAALRKNGSDAYVWSSDAGEIVTKVGK